MQIQHKLIRPLIWSVLATLTLYGMSLFVSDLQSVGVAIARFGYLGWFIILGLSLLNYGLRFIRWQYYLGHLNYRIPLGSSLVYYLSGFAFTTTPGKAGEMVRSRYLHRHGVTYIHSMAAFFAERFLDLIAMVLLALSAVYLFPMARTSVIVLAVVALSMLSLLHVDSTHKQLNRLLICIPSKRIQFLGSHFLKMLRSASILLSSRSLYTGLFLGIIAWAAEGFAFYLILTYLGTNLSPMLAVGIYAVSVLIGALSFIPGGIGTTEATMGLLLMSVGVDTATAIAVTLICRLSTLWFAVGIGFINVVVLETMTPRGTQPSSNLIHSKSKMDN